MRVGAVATAEELDNNGFADFLTAQTFALELISLIRVMPQIEISRLLRYNQENTCFLESCYLASTCRVAESLD